MHPKVVPIPVDSARYKTILQVDDDLAWLVWSAETLTQAGYLVLTARSCREADELRRKYRRIDLLAVNPFLPGFTALMKRLRRNFPSLKLIALLDGALEPPMIPDVSILYRKPRDEELKAVTNQLDITIEWLRLVFELLRNSTPS